MFRTFHLHPLYRNRVGKWSGNGGGIINPAYFCYFVCLLWKLPLFTAEYKEPSILLFNFFLHYFSLCLLLSSFVLHLYLQRAVPNRKYVLWKAYSVSVGQLDHRI